MCEIMTSEMTDDGFDLFFIRPMAIWPEGLEKTDERIDRVASCYLGVTLTEGDVIRICGC